MFCLTHYCEIFYLLDKIFFEEAGSSNVHIPLFSVCAMFCFTSIAFVKTVSAINVRESRDGALKNVHYYKYDYYAIMPDFRSYILINIFIFTACINSVILG